MEYLHGTGWDQPAIAAEPALASDIDCDVVVVGGGGGGMSAALRLAEHNVDVVLLEARTLGWGATSRNGGYLTSSIATEPSLLRLLMKPDKLRDLYGFAENAVAAAERAMEDHGIDCGYERTGMFLAATTESQLRRARRNADTMAEAGADAVFVDGADAGLPDGFLGGVHERPGGTLNPAAFARGMRAATIGAGVRVHENTPALDIKDSPGGVTVETPGGRVRARKAVLTANAHNPEFSISPKSLAAPVWTSLVETEPVEPERLDEIGWTSRSPMITLHPLIENYRVSPQGTIIFGTRRVQSGRHPLPDRTPAEHVADDLLRGFRDRFPGLRDVQPKRTWGGWIGLTPTWLPVAGEASDNVLYSLACNGHGFAQAQYVGQLLADRARGASPHEDLGAIWHGRRSRFLPNVVSGPTTYAAWLASRAEDRIATLASRR